MDLYQISETFRRDHGLRSSGSIAHHGLVVVHNDISGTEKLEVQRKLPLVLGDGRQVTESVIEAYSIPGFDSDAIVKIATGSLLDYVQQLESAKADCYWNELCEQTLAQFKVYANNWHWVKPECTPEELLREDFKSIEVADLTRLLRIFFPPTVQPN